MIHYLSLTEQLTRSYGQFGAMVLTFRPSIVGGYSCVATIRDSVIRDIFRDLGREYSEKRLQYSYMRAQGYLMSTNIDRGVTCQTTCLYLSM